MEPETPVVGDGYFDLGLDEVVESLGRDSPNIVEDDEDDTEDLRSRFHNLFSDPASPEARAHEDPYGFQSPPSRPAIFSPSAGLPAAPKAPH